MPHALFVESRDTTLTPLMQLAQAEGYEVGKVRGVPEARAALASHPELVVLDLERGEGEGQRLLDELRPPADSAVVFVTDRPRTMAGGSSLSQRVTASLPRPVDKSRLQMILADIAHAHDAEHHPPTASVEPAADSRFGFLVGTSPSMQNIYRLITRIAPSTATVVVSGETGTGKEAVARTIHQHSGQASAPFEAVNCGAISPHLIESELFGHERGSFTGADRRHRGYFERTGRGTLLLDEITEMPSELQVKLLRVLEMGEYVRVGGEAAVSMEARVLAATNRNVGEAIGDGSFREDLYYRLNVFHIELPPLRERLEDIERLATHFLREVGPADGPTAFDAEALDLMRSYPWPGNVRELRNVVHGASIMATGDLITTAALPSEIRRREPMPRTPAGPSISLPVGSSLDEMERRVILATLDHVQGQKRHAAELLGISLKTLYNRLHRYRRSNEHLEGGHLVRRSSRAGR